MRPVGEQFRGVERLDVLRQHEDREAGDAFAGFGVGAQALVGEGGGRVGEIATYFPRAHPDEVAGAVLVDASLPPFYTTAETDKIVAANQQQIDALKGPPVTPSTRQLLDEADDYGPVHLAYHELSWPTTVPATAIVSATTPFLTADDAQLWRQAQQEFVNAAPNRHPVMADRSSHDVPVDRPDVVIKAVEDMVHQGR